MATSITDSDSSNAPQLSGIFEEARNIQVELEDSAEPTNSQGYQVGISMLNLYHWHEFGRKMCKRLVLP